MSFGLVGSAIVSAFIAGGAFADGSRWWIFFAIAAIGYGAWAVLT